jgi:hypothetical protein
MPKLPLRLAVLLACLLTTAVVAADQVYGLFSAFDSSRPWQSIVDRFAGDADVTVKSVTPPQSKPAVELSLEARLFRSALIGHVYGIPSVSKALAASEKRTALTTDMASAAAAALNEPSCCDVPDSAMRLRELLATEKTLRRMEAPSDLPPLNNDDLILLHAYALVLGGRAEDAVTELSKSFAEYSVFSQSVSIVALRAIGTASAKQRLTQHGSTDTEIKMMADESVSIVRPNFAEPKMYESEMPFAQRTRSAILTQASNDRNGTRTIMPTLLLGYVGDDADPVLREQELQYLRSVPLRKDENLWYRQWYGAVSLALRSTETFDYWHERFRSESAAYTRMLLIRIMAQHFPADFLRVAPEIAATEPVDWARSDTMMLAQAIARGDQSLGALDFIWFPPKRYRMNFPAQPGAFKPSDPDGILTRFAQGNFAKADQCPACTASWLTRLRRPDNEHLFVLGVINSGHRDNGFLSSLSGLTDTRLKAPLTAFANSIAEGSEARLQIESAIREIDEPSDGKGPRQCCALSEVCLASQVPDLTASTVLSTVAQAKDFLKSLPPKRTPRVVIDPEDKRRATITFESSPAEAWTHWLGCWRRDS